MEQVSLVHSAKSTSQLTDMQKLVERPGLGANSSSLTRSFRGRGSVGNCNAIKDLGLSTVVLGPGQIHPKGIRLPTPGRYGELQMGFLLQRGVLEIDINRARNFLPVDSDSAPDTYVKCYINDGERLRCKKKTRIVRHSLEPSFKQCLKYQATEINGRVVIMLWQKGIGFDHNQGIGAAEVNVDDPVLHQQILAWYPLLPINSTASEANDSP